MASFQSKMIEGLIRISGMKARYNRRLMHVEQQKKPEMQALPSKTMYQKYHITTKDVNGQTVFTLAPRTGVSNKHIYYLHGGGFIDGFSSLHWDLLGKLIDGLNCTITAPDYPLLPAANSSDIFAMVFPIYKDLIASVGAANLTIMGDSAGGALSLVLAQKLREEGCPPPAHLVLLSPLLDVSMTNPAIRELEKVDPLFALPGAIHLGEVYAGQMDRMHPAISPLYGSLQDLGHVSVFIGTHEILLADARKLKARAEAEGIAIDYYEYEGMMHVWILFPLPEARHAIQRIIKTLMAEKEQSRPRTFTF
jgi:monoterpene epsilon-lactone hydrolase